MKTLASFVLLLMLGSAALASRGLVTRGEFMPEGDDASALYLGPAATLMESNYFQSPRQQPVAGRIFPCGLHQLVFDKTRIARSCN